MSFTNEDTAFLRELNGTEMPATLFQGAVHALEELGKDASHLEDRISTVTRFFSRHGYTFLETCRLAQAVEFRMRALLRLKNEHGMMNWGIPDTRTADDASDPYLAAAATEPLVQYGVNGVAFDPERFRARLTGAQPS